MTEVYAFDREGQPFSEACVSLLPSWRQERTARLKHPAARQESLVAGLLLRWVMARWGISPEEPVTILPAGKPVFSQRSDVFFSLSHSGRYVLCAISHERVGVDVQYMRPVNPSMARRFHPAEQQWLSERPVEEWEDAFYRLWTRKEAWVKAVSEREMLSLSQADVIRPLSGLRFWDRLLPGGYRASVCARTKEPDEIVFVTANEIGITT